MEKRLSKGGLTRPTPTRNPNNTALTSFSHAMVSLPIPNRDLK
jgi:hypothetical protein